MSVSPQANTKSKGKNCHSPAKYYWNGSGLSNAMGLSYFGDMADREL